MATLPQRAAAGLPLTPAERAFLKLCSGWLIDGVLAALGAIVIVLSQVNPQVTLGTIVFVAGAFLKSFLMALSHYLSARSDSAQAQAAAPMVSMLAGQIGTFTGRNEPKVGVDLTAVTAVGAAAAVSDAAAPALTPPATPG